MAKIQVKNTDLTIIQVTLPARDFKPVIFGGFVMTPKKWLRNKNTIEFIDIWEEMYNPDFNSPEFEGIKNAAGLNRLITLTKKTI
jgi:hypothetical protein